MTQVSLRELYFNRVLIIKEIQELLVEDAIKFSGHPEPN